MSNKNQLFTIRVIVLCIIAHVMKPCQCLNICLLGLVPFESVAKYTYMDH